MQCWAVQAGWQTFTPAVVVSDLPPQDLLCWCGYFVSQQTNWEPVMCWEIQPPTLDYSCTVALHLGLQITDWVLIHRLDYDSVQRGTESSTSPSPLTQCDLVSQHYCDWDILQSLIDEGSRPEQYTPVKKEWNGRNEVVWQSVSLFQDTDEDRTPRAEGDMV